jgi:DNA-binding transcriptional ArsR family regulator
MIPMNKPHWNDLEKKFHEPARLALVTALCERPAGLGFQDLKKRCGMTDGNLSRHLKVLEEGNVVRLHRAGRGRKAHTQVTLTPEGREEFHLYLQALEKVLHGALSSLQDAPESLGAFAAAS